MPERGPRGERTSLVRVGAAVALSLVGLDILVNAKTLMTAALGALGVGTGVWLYKNRHVAR